MHVRDSSAGLSPSGCETRHKTGFQPRGTGAEPRPARGGCGHSRSQLLPHSRFTVRSPSPAPPAPLRTVVLEPVHLAELQRQPQDGHVVQVLHLLHQAFPVRPQPLQPPAHCGHTRRQPRPRARRRAPSLSLSLSPVPIRVPLVPSRSKSLRKAASFLLRELEPPFFLAGAMAERGRVRTNRRQHPPNGEAARAGDARGARRAP